MLKMIILYFICVIGLFGCINQEKLKWVSYSVTMVDTNLMLDLPNVVKLKTGIEPECQGSPEQLVLEFISLIKNDTIKIEINTNVEQNHTEEFKRRIDSSFLKRMEDQLILIFPRVQIIERTKRIIGEEIIGIIKYSLDKQPYYKVLYKFHARHFILDIEGLNDEKIMSHIVESIRFEDQMDFLCW